MVVAAVAAQPPLTAVNQVESSSRRLRADIEMPGSDGMAARPQLPLARSAASSSSWPHCLDAEPGPQRLRSVFKRCIRPTSDYNPRNPKSPRSRAAAETVATILQS